MSKILILSHQDIIQLNLSLKEVISKIEEGLKKHSLGKTHLKPKVSITPQEGSFYTAMPAGIKDEILGLKLIERFKNENYPSVFGTLLLNDEKTKKINLTATVKNILENYSEKKKEVIDYREENFKNLGKASIEIVNLLDAIVENKKVEYLEKKKEVKNVNVLNNIYYRKYKILQLKGLIKQKIIFKNIFLKEIFYKFKRKKG